MIYDFRYTPPFTGVIAEFEAEKQVPKNRAKLLQIIGFFESCAESGTKSQAGSLLAASTGGLPQT
jgi:hypothetical protein